ncbi:MAG: DUF6151 family protein [Anderseniella sp.]
MTVDLAISCTCGKLRGKLHAVSPDRGARYVCHCKDCQAFIHFLERQSDVLDQNAGTGVFQTRPSRLTIASGIDQLRCIRLTAKPTLRWYARCCNSPLFNTTSSGRYPFLSVICHCIDPDLLDNAMGPIRGHLFVAEAIGDMSGKREAGGNRMLFAVIYRMICERLSGRSRNTPLFDPATGEPVAVATVMDPADRARLDTAIARRNGQ